jgi:hypothetical protein
MAFEVGKLALKQGSFPVLQAVPVNITPPKLHASSFTYDRLHII